MMYRNNQEHHQPPDEQDIHILRKWLKGEAENKSLRIWLNTLYNY